MINTNVDNIHNLIHSSKVLVFDFDGTIANTEPLHWEAYKLCLKEIGVQLQPADISRYIGNSELMIYNFIKHDFSVDFNNDEFFTKRLHYFYKLVDDTELKPFPSLINIMEQYSINSKLILSSQALSVISYLLKKWRIEEWFSRIISAPHESRTKEDILANFSEYSQCENKDVVFFDDLNRHVSLAISYGMKGVAVTKKETLSEFANLDGFVLIE
jgi:beta-phosphoglucomutase